MTIRQIEVDPQNSSIVYAVRDRYLKAWMEEPRGARAYLSRQAQSIASLAIDPDLTSTLYAGL